MASAWRVISFFLVVFVLPTVLISLPLYARYHLYHARDLYLAETDTRSLDYAVSSFWCQGQRVTSNGSMDAYLVPGELLEERKRQEVTLTHHLDLHHDDIEYWGLYLLQGSSFTLTASARWPGGTVLVVEGEENLRRCFYKEERLESQLAEGPAPGPSNIYHASPDLEDDLEGIQPQDQVQDDHGGEVFDEEEGEGLLRALLQDAPVPPQAVSSPPAHLALPVPVPPVPQAPRLPQAQGAVQEGEVDLSKAKKKGRKNRRGKKKRKNRVQEEVHHGREKRGLADQVWRAAEEAEEPMADWEVGLEILHQFNDSVVVTTGNSSFSSSEEFLEQCRHAIIMVDLSPALEWRAHLRPAKKNVEGLQSWKVAVNSSNYYYFIFTSDNSIELNHMGFRLDIERVRYDVSAPLQACTNATQCLFPLSFSQTEAVVVEVPATETHMSQLHTFHFTTTCQPRVPVYMVFILLVPFIILIFAFQ